MEIIFFIVIIVIFLGLPVLQMRKQSRQVGEIRNFQSQLEPGMVVQTTSGIHGRITSVGPTTVDLELAAGVVTTWDRNAVLKLVTSVEADSTEAAHLTGGAGDAAASAEGTGVVPDDLSGLEGIEDYRSNATDADGADGSAAGTGNDGDDDSDNDSDNDGEQGSTGR
jgi:preprotein translocase subunit YajC